MKLTGHRKVHNAPIGYEIDRIELAVKQIGADRVYLIKDPDESKQGLLYLKELTRRITRLIPAEELKTLECPIWDFQKTMSLLCELVRREKSAGNFVYINLSIRQQTISRCRNTGLIHVRRNPPLYAG